MQHIGAEIGFEGACLPHVLPVLKRHLLVNLLAVGEAQQKKSQLFIACVKGRMANRTVGKRNGIVKRFAFGRIEPKFGLFYRLKGLGEIMTALGGRTGSQDSGKGAKE